LEEVRLLLRVAQERLAKLARGVVLRQRLRELAAAGLVGAVRRELLEVAESSAWRCASFSRTWTTSPVWRSKKCVILWERLSNPTIRPSQSISNGINSI
jgi:hypothetical protein